MLAIFYSFSEINLKFVCFRLFKEPVLYRIWDRCHVELGRICSGPDKSCGFLNDAKYTYEPMQDC